MKKKILLCLLTTHFIGVVNAQVIPIPAFSGFDPCQTVVSANASWTGEPQKLFSRCADVKVGIGTNNPTHSLHVLLDARFNQAKIDFNQGIGAEPSSFSKLYIRNPTQDAAIEVNQSGNNKQYQKLLSFQYTNPTTEILKAYNSETGTVSYLFEASGKMTINNGITNIFQLDPSGKLTIKSNLLPILQLENNGLLRVRNVRVDTESWPDYVFGTDYELMPLSEVEQFISEKGHLPNIPSEATILEQGIDVVEMNVKMLEKIEELTLYLIEQEKKIAELKQQIMLLNNEK